MLKKFFSFLLLMIAVAASGQNKVQEEACYNPNLVKNTSKKSIKSVAFAVINGDSMKINYHSPGVRKRVIWGGLVPYDEVWITGAHDATTLEISKTFIANGKEVPAGSMRFSLYQAKKNG